LIILLSLFGLNLFSQTLSKTVLDSSYTYLWQSEDWELSYKWICIHDKYGRVYDSTFLSRDKESGAWHFERRYFYRYGKNKKCSRYFEVLCWGNDNGCDTNARFNYYYDSNNYLIKETRQYYKSYSQEWVNSDRTVYMYNDEGEMTERRDSRWDEEKSKWKSYHNYYTYYYGMSGKILQWDSYKLNNDGEWIGKDTERYTYDGSGNLIIREFRECYNPELGNWGCHNKYEYSYNVSDDLVETKVYTGHGGGIWNLYMKRTYHKTNDNVFEEVHYRIDNENPGGIRNTKILKYFSKISVTISSMNVQNRMNIYPNPILDHFVIELPDNKSFWMIELLDLQGRVIRTVHNSMSNEVIIPRDNIPPGIYLIRIYSDEIYTEKVIAQ